MMPQMEAGDPREQPRAAYGAYSGNQDYAQQQYHPPYDQTPPGTTYDDSFVEDLAQRIAQRTTGGSGSAGKIYTQFHTDSKASAGQRLALAIVSIVMLIPIAGIFAGAIGGFGALIGFGLACMAFVMINAVFNNAFKS